MSAYFDVAEFRALHHEPTYMKDWLAHLERLIVVMGGSALRGAGSVIYQQAQARARAEYAKYRKHMDAQPPEVETAFLESVKAVQKKITGKKKP